MWEWNTQLHNYTLYFCFAKHSLLVCYTLSALWELSDINSSSSVCYFKHYAKENLLKRLMVSVMLLWIQWDCLKLLLLLHSLLQPLLLLPPTTSTPLNFCCLRFSNYTQIRYQCISWDQNLLKEVPEEGPHRSRAHFDVQRHSVCECMFSWIEKFVCSIVCMSMISIRKCGVG